MARQARRRLELNGQRRAWRQRHRTTRLDVRRTKLDCLPRRPQETSDGGLLIQDVAGDVFRIERPEALDEKSRELVWELVD